MILSEPAVITHNTTLCTFVCMYRNLNYWVWDMILLYQILNFVQYQYLPNINTVIHSMLVIIIIIMTLHT